MYICMYLRTGIFEHSCLATQIRMFKNPSCKIHTYTICIYVVIHILQSQYRYWVWTQTPVISEKDTPCLSGPRSYNKLHQSVLNIRTHDPTLIGFRRSSGHESFLRTLLKESQSSLYLIVSLFSVVYTPLFGTTYSHSS